MRVVMFALGLCALSFVAGVAGDLSRAAPPPATSVTVHVPPDAIRARPLPPLTDSERAELTRLERPVSFASDEAAAAPLEGADEGGVETPTVEAAAELAGAPGSKAERIVIASLRSGAGKPLKSESDAKLS
ncbi:MAG: hypothetical protein AB7O04_16175 [Hyphomonadaceae bacterium]